jgi:16S rRNA (cytosine1402-N4)-methyltransferase
LRVLSRKAIIPGPDELRRNPRARSAKMRVAERI